MQINTVPVVVATVFLRNRERSGGVNSREPYDYAQYCKPQAAA
jgi:hypothetical protein